MKRRSSLRTTLAPIPSTPIALSLSDRMIGRDEHPSQPVVLRNFLPPHGGLFGGLRDLHAGGGIQHRFDDVVIAGTAADIAFQLMPDRRLVELAAMAVDDIDRR